VVRPRSKDHGHIEIELGIDELLDRLRNLGAAVP
jgi:hypothetical protein